MATGQVLRPSTRIPWMDRLRVVTIAGVVVAHAATAYVVDIGWYYEERTSRTMVSDLLLLPFFPAAIYGLAPLFLIAGWLSAQSLSRRAPGAFARSRLLRLGLPVLVYFTLIDPLADYLGGTVVGETRSLGSYLVDLSGDHDVGPVWFVIALLVFSLVLAAWWAARPARRGEPLEGQPVQVRTLACVAAGVSVADFVVWLGFSYLDDSLWNAQVAHWPQAAGVFVLGVLAFQRGWFATTTAAFARRCGQVALTTMLGFAALVGVVALTVEDPLSVIGGWHWVAAVFAALDGVSAVALCLWVAHWMGRRWNAPLGPWLEPASRSSYAAYLLHPLVLVAISAAARPLPWPPEAKFVLVAAVGVPACFAIGYLFTRLPGVRAVV
jgi:peptidoglycan/LPS O-acetylase OafA/YrhL